MGVGKRGGDASTRGTLNETSLNQKGFINIFQRIAVLTNGGSDCVDADRSAVVVVD